jgi:serine/threonine-protein kinase
MDANFCIRCGAPLLLGKMYRILSVLKEGGMGTVYRGVDQWGTLCALKELRDQFTDPQERESGIRRFLEEGRVLHSLRDHAAIPKVYRSFVDNGRYYLAMEFIQGDDLEDVLQKRGRFSEAQVLLWADQLCDVLQYLHDNGLIYRDMKPSNVMIARDGRVKVIDFGIAQVLRPGYRGTMIGTPGYAPPEQYQGITNAQSDIYALAATLHHLVTGRDPREHPPFSFPPAHSINNDVSKATSRALQKALQMEMEDRFPTVDAFRKALPIGEVVEANTRAFEETPKHRRGSPVPASTPRKPARPSATAARPNRQSFRQRARRVLLTGIIGAVALFTAPNWAPPLGAAIGDVIDNIVDVNNDDRSAAPIAPAPSSAASAVAQPSMASPQPSSEAIASAPAPSPSTVVQSSAVVPSASAEAQPSTLPQESAPASVVASPAVSPSGPREQQYRAELTIEVPAGTPVEELVAQFGQALLDKARQEYPGAELANQELGFVPLSEDQEIERSDLGDGRVRIRADIVGTILVPAP